MNANEVTIWLDPEDGTKIYMNFTAIGARNAISRVFESCGGEARPVSQ